MNPNKFGKTLAFLAAMAIIAAKDAIAAQFKALVEGGQLQVTDHRFVFAKACGGQTLIKLTDSADPKSTGITNISNGKPAPNQFMLLEGIKITAINPGAVPDAAALRAGAFATISGVAGLINGWLTIKSDKKNIIYQLPMSVFATGNNADGESLVYYLDNPKPIYPERDLDIEIELGTASTANLGLKIELIGSCTQV